MSATPWAWRIETERMVIRPWRTVDAPALREAIECSLEHLRPWMPWALDEPAPLADKIALIEGWEGSFAHGRELPYGLFSPHDRLPLGSSGLHDRVGGNAREIGYWIRADREGEGLVSEAVAALTRVGFEVMGLERLEIRCDPANVRSAAVPRRLGYTLEAVVPADDTDGPSSRTETMIWAVERARYPDTPSAAARITAWSRTGRQLLARR